MSQIMLIFYIVFKCLPINLTNTRIWTRAATIVSFWYL